MNVYLGNILIFNLYIYIWTISEEIIIKKTLMLVCLSEM